MRGLTPRVVTFVPSNALSWLAYEGFKVRPLSVFWSSLASLNPPIGRVRKEDDGRSKLH
jgi:hypothetical protein